MLGDSIRRRTGRSGRTGRGSPDGAGTRLAAGARLALITAGLAVAGFGAAYLLATFILYPPGEALGAVVEVPDLLGEPIDEAREILRNAGLSVAETTDVPDPTEAEGRVVAQSPLAGQALRPGAGVRLALSAGPARLRVPNLLGFEEATALAILERAGFRVERSEEIADEPAGRVARIQPAPGSEQEIPATVVLVISTGPPDEVSEDSLAADAPPDPGRAPDAPVPGVGSGEGGR